MFFMSVHAADPSNSQQWPLILGPSSSTHMFIPSLQLSTHLMRSCYQIYRSSLPLRLSAHTFIREAFSVRSYIESNAEPLTENRVECAIELGVTLIRWSKVITLHYPWMPNIMICSISIPFQKPIASQQTHPMKHYRAIHRTPSIHLCIV